MANEQMPNFHGSQALDSLEFIESVRFMITKVPEDQGFPFSVQDFQ